MMNIPLLLVTCDKYSPLWDGFCFLLNKYWPNKPNTIFLCTESKSFSSDFFTVIPPPACNRNERSWSTRLINTLANIHSEFVFFALEDYFIYQQVDTEFLSEAISLIENNKKVAVVHFEGRHLSDSERLSLCPANPKFVFASHKTSNIATTGFSLWRTSFLLAILIKRENPWQFEYAGSYRLGHLVKNGRAQVLFVTPKPDYSNFIYPFIYHVGGVVSKGVVNKEKASFFAKHDGVVCSMPEDQTILNTYLGNGERKKSPVRFLRNRLYKIASLIVMLLSKKRE